MNSSEQTIVLKHKNLQAKVSPVYGMSLMDFRVDDVSILDLSRDALFYKSRKGLGPIIGPHFNQSPIVPVVEENKFEHIAHLQALGIKDVFQHGVGRYINWEFKTTENSVTGTISGDTEIAGYKLKYINGFDFNMSVKYTLGQIGLVVAFEVSGDKPIQAGTHFYYDLVSRDTACVHIDVAGGRKTYDFNGKKFDDVFVPEAISGDHAQYQLVTDTFELDTIVKVKGNKENTFDSLIIHSPEGASFVCVEPISQYRGEVNDKCQFSSEILLVARKR